MCECECVFSVLVLFFFLIHILSCTHCLTKLSLYLIPIDFNQNVKRESYFHCAPHAHTENPSQIVLSFWPILHTFAMRFSILYTFGSPTITLFLDSLCPPPPPRSSASHVAHSTTVYSTWALCFLYLCLLICWLSAHFLSYLTMKTCFVFIHFTQAYPPPPHVHAYLIEVACHFFKHFQTIVPFCLCFDSCGLSVLLFFLLQRGKKL